MKRLINHLLAMFVTVLIFTPVFSAANPKAMVAFTPMGVALSGLIVAMVLTFLTFTVFAPVASISHYLIENRLMVHILVEPLVTLGVMILYVAGVASAIALMTQGSFAPLYLSMLLSYALPTLLYWVMLRLTSNWEYER